MSAQIAAADDCVPCSRARLRMSRCTRSGSLSFLSTLEMSLSAIAVKYSLAGPRAALPDKPSAPGHPPRQTSSQTSSNSRVLFAPVTSSPAKTLCIDTSPVDSPLSQRLIGRMVSRAIRPVPVCLGTRSSDSSSTSGGTALPVRINSPLPPLSTAERTASHISGPSCHSSISRGVAPSNNLSGRV